MPAETPDATTAEQPVATPPAAAGPERGQALIQKHVAATEAAMRAERDEEEAPAAEEAEKPATPQRGKDGKFVAGERGSTSPHKAGQPGATPGPATEEDKPKEEPAKTESALKGSDARASKLIKEGKISEALEVIGLSADKLEGKHWAAFDKHSKRVASQIGEARQAIEREKAELTQVAQQVWRDVAPFIEAKKAIAAEDDDKAFQILFGQSVDDYMRSRVRKLANPSVEALQKRLEQRERLDKEREQQEAQRAQQIQAQRAQLEQQERAQNYRKELTEELKASDDPRIAKAAERQLFIEEVLAVQRKYYDKASDWTLPASEAAQRAFEKLYGEYSEWNEIFAAQPGGSSQGRVTGANKPVGVTGAANPVRRTAKSTSLNPSEAAEAAPPVKLKGKALMDYYVRKTEESIRNAG